MPAHSLDAIFFIQSVPLITFRDGLFHVCYEIGRQARFEIVMPPTVFMQAKHLADDARARWQLGQLESGNVTSINKKRR